MLSKEPLGINALCACVYIYIRQLSSFRVPTLWFINLALATGHIQYTFLSLCQFFPLRKRTKHENTDDTKMAADRYWAYKALIQREL